MKNVFAKVACAAAVALALPALAAPVVFTGTAGTRSASVGFDIVGGQLQVVLSNIAATDVLVPVDVLTGVFFNISGNPALTRVSAISGGPTFLNGVQISPAGTVVGGEWAYLNGLSQYAANSGISSSGLGIFGPGDLFPGANLFGPASPDGLQYGLLSAGDNLATGNAAIQSDPLTRSSVSFLLSGLSNSFTLANISNITFQYGTALTEPNVVGSSSGGGQSSSGNVPEPGSTGLALLGLAILGGTLGVRSKRRQPESA